MVRPRPLVFALVALASHHHHVPVFVQGSAETDQSAAANENFLAACLSSDPEEVESAVQDLKHGADINARDARTGQTCLMASTLRGNVDMVMLMLERGADATVPEKDGYTPPHGAGFQGRPDVMRVLKEVGGIDVINSPHADGFFPIHRACWGREPRHAKTVEYLLSIGEDPNRMSTGARKQTCLEMTSNPHTIEVLKKYGASVESPSGHDEM